ncbi:DUF7473 family protein [Haloferacaceae archaeon DSL9]
MLLQSTAVSPLAIAGTLGSLAVFLSLTAHIAARNVLGDVGPSKALGVGLLPAVVAVLTVLFSLPAALGILVAVLLDGLAIHALYGQRPRLSAYITFIHIIVSILLGTVLIGTLLLVFSAPT